MAIHIYERMSFRNHLFVISDELYDSLEENIIEDFQKKTGIFIDNYGVVAVNIEELVVLHGIIELYINSSHFLQNIAQIKKFGLFIERAIDENRNLKFVGD